ncbi:DUF5960 family protein [Streptococcus suis]|uniref:DUF5960 family protein n=1 Tax=Streptococcus suis TaxID=1307 RepID=UPI003D7695BD
MYCSYLYAFINFFKLNEDNAEDNRDHYIQFNIEPIENNKLIRKYVYLLFTKEKSKTGFLLKYGSTISSHLALENLMDFKGDKP